MFTLGEKNKKSPMKILFIILLSIISISNTDEVLKAEDLPFLKIKKEEFPKLIAGHWHYDYSFNSNKTFEINGVYLQEHYVPYRLEFNKTTKKVVTKLVKNHPWLNEYRNSSCLSDLEFWVDEKGMMRYPKLQSESMDLLGYLIQCKIQLKSKYDSGESSYMTINSVSKGILVISNYQNDSRNDYHIFVRE